ncbi:MAG: SLC13 family permease [Bryobacteraceae bacterium]|nr:SLC13 family permease [Bryobacteraceae bacterium]
MELFIVLVVVLACVYALATEKLPVDLTAIFVAIVLVVTRVLTPEQGLSGLGNPATVTVAAMFVLSAGLARTGALNSATTILSKLGRRLPWVAILSLMLVVGAASAFVNNTAVVAIFLPIVLTVGRSASISASRLLMPLSFASMFGGVCTLIGTSTNILVSSIAASHGLRPFSMFEFSEFGLITAGIGLAYMFTIGIRLIPERRAASDLTEVFGLANYLTDAVLMAGAKSIGTVAASSPLAKDLDVEILAVFRNSELIDLPVEQIVLLEGDVVRLRCDTAQLDKLRQRHGISLISHLGWRDQDLQGGEFELVEAVVAPNSVLTGQTLKSMRFSDRFVAKVLAIRHHGQLARTKLDNAPIRAGDTMLLSVRSSELETLARDPAFVLITPKAMSKFRPAKTLAATAILAAVIAASALNLVPIVVAALAGCALMVLSGCLKPGEVYTSVDWKVILLIGGLLPLGIALETTGAAALLSQFVVKIFGGFGPLVLLSAIYLCTSLLTELMSNAAAAVLLAPIAISAAAAMGVDSRPFLVAVTFAASSSFMTPVGYQTNTLIYGPGAYRFRDFVRVGTPLNLIFWIAATVLIPRFWPFYP